jgi:hypothetical protein
MKQIFIAVSATFLITAFAHAQMPVPLRITTEKQQKTRRDVKERAKTTGGGYGVTVHYPEVAEQSQSVVMNIKIQNMSAKDLKGLSVKYVMFGKDKASNQVKDDGQGQRNVDIKSLQTVTLETDPVDFASEEVTYRNGHFSELNQRKGEQYYGIAVGVYVGSSKIASYYEPSGLDQHSRKLGVEP